jgi:hypothetical protein
VEGPSRASLDQAAKLTAEALAAFYEKHDPPKAAKAAAILKVKVCPRTLADAQSLARTLFKHSLARSCCCHPGRYTAQREGARMHSLAVDWHCRCRSALPSARRTTPPRTW